MIRGLYSAAGGMQATSLQQDVTAHNLNHAMKPGYQREVLRFNATGPREELLGPEATLHTDFSPGTLEFTGNTLDVALNGPGFFQIQGPSGPLYTRSGTFQLNGQGQIVTPEGRIVRGTAGPITIPPDAVNIDILDDGTVIADGGEIDQLSVVAFQNPNDLSRVGTTYFAASPNAARSEAGPEVRQGYRENGNTTVVQEMVQMIAGLRQFEAAQRALRSLGDTIALNTRPLNR
ncbi:MAG: flagellar hook basal-body protein [Planctomycetota bacterium]